MEGKWKVCNRIRSSLILLFLSRAEMEVHVVERRKQIEVAYFFHSPPMSVGGDRGGGASCQGAGGHSEAASGGRSLQVQRPYLVEKFLMLYRIRQIAHGDRKRRIALAEGEAQVPPGPSSRPPPRPSV